MGDKIESRRRLPKGKDLCEVQFFGKFIMCSNNEDTPVLIEPGETRYWVRKINPLKK